VVQHALLVVRDTLGVLVGGSRQPENAAAARMAVGLGGPGRSSVAGASEGTSAHVAAMLNATSAVTLELDEGNQFALNHPAIHVLPAALAVAEEVGATSAQFLEAFLCGYEVAVRFGAATRLRDQVHPFGTTAVVGAAAAGGKLHGLSEEELRGCLLLAAGTAIASSQTAANSGASVRNLAAGLTAHNGVLAVALHRAGFTGEERVFDRVFGEILGTEWREEDVAFGQDDFFITRNYFKLHACSRWNHAPIEAAGDLLRQGLSLDELERVRVWTYDPAVRLAAPFPKNGYAAKHSIPFNVAAALLWGSNDLVVFTDEAVRDPRILELQALIEVREDPGLTALLPAVRPARVEAELRDGRTLTAYADRLPGGFDQPFSEDELLAKFRRLAGMGLPRRRVDDLLRACTYLGSAPSIEPLTTILRDVAPALR